MGLWLMAPLALFAAILLWDREKLFTLEKSLALLNILAATPWCVTLGISAELFPEWAFQAGWYLAIPELVVGAVATGIWFARSRQSAATGAATAIGTVTGGATGAAGDAAGGAAGGVTGGARSGGGHSGATADAPWSEKLLGAGPWLLGYGVVLTLLMFWARNRI